MPLVRISLPEGKSEGEVAAIAEGVQRAMAATISVPEQDRFQIITEHAPGRLILDPTYLGVRRGAGAMIIHIILHAGRSDECCDPASRAAGTRRTDSSL